MGVGIPLSKGTYIESQNPNDAKYFNDTQPWASVAEVLAGIPIGERHIGLPVNIDKVEYKFKEGIEDADLVLKDPIITFFFTETVGENVLTGDVLYLKNDGKYYKSSNLDVVKSKGILLIATEDITTDSLGKLSKTGVHTDVLTEEFDIGSLVFLGANGDYISELEAISLLPTNVMRVIGQINSSGKLDFTPGESFIEVI
jgi:hypothetical protein